MRGRTRCSSAEHTLPLGAVCGERLVQPAGHRGLLGGGDHPAACCDDRQRVEIFFDPAVGAWGGHGHDAQPDQIRQVDLPLQAGPIQAQAVQHPHYGPWGVEAASASHVYDLQQPLADLAPAGRKAGEFGGEQPPERERLRPGHRYLGLNDLLEIRAAVANAGRGLDRGRQGVAVVAEHVGDVREVGDGTYEAKEFGHFARLEPVPHRQRRRLCVARAPPARQANSSFCAASVGPSASPAAASATFSIAAPTIPIPGIASPASPASLPTDPRWRA